MDSKPKTSCVVQDISSLQEKELKKFARRIDRLGGKLVVVDSKGCLLLADDDQVSPESSLQHYALTALQAHSYHGSGDTELAVQRFDQPGPILAGVLTLYASSRSQGNRRVVMLIDLGESEHKEINRHCEIIGEMLGCFIDSFESVATADQQMEMVGAELSQVYEELVLLHRLSTNMKVTESDANFLQLACDSLTEVISVEGIAIVVERWVEHERRWMVVAGSGLIDLDEGMECSIYGRLQEEVGNGHDALLDSEVFSTFQYEWPDTVRNIIAVPLYGKDTQESQLVQHSDNVDTMIGYMVAVNALQKQDFDSTDIKLFNSVVNRCAVFIENGRLFTDLQELFMGSLRALTSSIDAKDGYTHGHSERVALICRWIAEHAARTGLLTPEQVHEAYFVGLLHDIGKIGIEDWVLRKGGPLTPEELECIHNHPNIGAGILRGIKQMRDIVPGVLHHHERFDGRGYPQGLSGQDIPVLARIVGLADSFDAMTSRRSYRQARSIEEAAEDIRRHLGTQFDPELGTVFLDSDLQRLWDLMQGGSELHYGREAADYGATAVGTLIR
jgi:HD-GYP domain-containing protein (c-di-GMP phosphodiesterase class II)